MHVLIAKVDETLYDGDAEALVVQGVEGEMTILAHHIPLITILKQGIIRVIETKYKDKEPLQFPVDGGVLEINRDGATVIL